MEINQELIQRFYRGLATKAEIKLIAKYIYSDEIEQDLRKELEAEYQKQQVNAEFSTKNSFARIRKHIEAANEKPVVRKFAPDYIVISKIAATLTILVTVVYLMFTLIQPIGENKSQAGTDLPATITKITGKGQKLHLTLPDGSMAVLNANSQLTFPRQFNQSVRNIELAGEAYFEVVKDTLKPFIVDAGQIAVEVLGTSFNVKAGATYQDQVALVEGSVKVRDHMNGAEKLIKPGELLIHQPDGFTTTSFDYEQTIAWKDGLLYFERDKLEQILQKLENWYGVEFDLKGSRPEIYHYSGKFKNKSLEEVLSGISYVMMFDFSLVGDEKVIIELNPKPM